MRSLIFIFFSSCQLKWAALHEPPQASSLRGFPRGSRESAWHLCVGASAHPGVCPGFRVRLPRPVRPGVGPRAPADSERAPGRTQRNRNFSWRNAETDKREGRSCRRGYRGGPSSMGSSSGLWRCRVGWGRPGQAGARQGRERTQSVAAPCLLSVPRPPAPPASSSWLLARCARNHLTQGYALPPFQRVPHTGNRWLRCPGCRAVGDTCPLRVPARVSHTGAKMPTTLGTRQPCSASSRGGARGSPPLRGLHPHREGGHGGDGLGFFVLTLLGLDQGAGRGGGQALQGAPVLAWGRSTRSRVLWGRTPAGSPWPAP